MQAIDLLSDGTVAACYEACLAANPDDELVLLTTCRDNVEAMGLRALLESEDIEVLIQGEHTAAVHPILGYVIELRVLVRKRDLGDALELLEEGKYAEHLPADPVDPADVDDASIHRWREKQSAPDVDVEGPGQAIDAPHSERNPAVALALAFLIPLGTGHFYARRWWRGAIIGALELTDWVLMARGWNTWVALVLLALIDGIGGVVAIRSDNRKAPAGRGPRS